MHVYVMTMQHNPFDNRTLRYLYVSTFEVCDYLEYADIQEVYSRPLFNCSIIILDKSKVTSLLVT